VVAGSTLWLIFTSPGVTSFDARYENHRWRQLLSTMATSVYQLKQNGAICSAVARMRSCTSMLTLLTCDFVLTCVFVLTGSTNNSLAHQTASTSWTTVSAAVVELAAIS